MPKMIERPFFLFVYKSHLKNVDYVQRQGASRRKSAAYKGVCEHFEEARNTVIGR
jgi:hypothetical protein